jgi:hypothetical protein
MGTEGEETKAIVTPSKAELRRLPPLELEEMETVFGKAKEEKGKELMSIMDGMRGLKEGERGTFFYDIWDGEGDERQAIHVYVGYQPQNHESLEVRLFGVNLGQSEVINKLRGESLLRVSASREIVHQILTDNLDPLQAALTRRVDVKGNMSFIVKNPLVAQNFFKAIGEVYQRELLSRKTPLQEQPREQVPSPGLVRAPAPSSS